MRRRPMVQMLAFGAVAIVLGLVLALLIPWFPSKGSQQAQRIHTLYDVLLIASVPMFVLVATVVLFSVIRFRARPGDELRDGPPIHGNTRLEVVWTALPTVLVVSLCTYAYTVLRANEDSKKGETIVNVTERQFAFEFSYPGPHGTVVSPVLYLAKGQPYVFKLRAMDVIHSFFVPEFSQKLDAVPGITTTLRVTPTRTGSYPAECTELCGAGHALMRASVRVVSPAAFQAWLSSQKANASPPVGTPPPGAAQAGEPGAGPGAPGGGTSEGTGAANSGPGAGAGGTTYGSSGASGSSGSGGATSGGSGGSSSSSADIAAGKTLFTGSAGCSTCHTLAAAGSTGTTGPNLGTAPTADAKKRGLPLMQFLMESITKPNAYISSGYPPNVMPPNFGQTLSPTQIKQLAAFIASATK